MAKGEFFRRNYYTRGETESWRCPYCGEISVVIYDIDGEVICEAGCYHFNEDFGDYDEMFLEDFEDIDDE